MGPCLVIRCHRRVCTLLEPDCPLSYGVRVCTRVLLYRIVVVCDACDGSCTSSIPMSHWHSPAALHGRRSKERRKKSTNCGGSKKRQQRIATTNVFFIAYHTYITCTTVLRIALASGVVRWVIERHARRRVLRPLISVITDASGIFRSLSLHTLVH